MIAEAIRSELAADATIIACLTTYEFTTGVASPAIFTYAPAPANCGHKVLTIEEGGGSWTGSRATKGGEMDVDVSGWDDKGLSFASIRQLAWLVWAALDRIGLDLSGDGFEECGVYASPPRFLRDPDGFPGFVISVMVRFMEEM